MTLSHRTVRVWDLPTRLFHWALVVCVVGAYTTVKLGGLWMDWHTRFGLAALALIVFRIIWGIIGPRYVRFTQFVPGPRTLVAYLRGNIPHTVGHNPLGACSVIALLLIFGIQAGSGLFANDDIMTSGPLAYLSSNWSGRLTWLHNVNEWFILGIVALHVCAILWYRLVRKKNLVGAMVHGDQQLMPGIHAHPTGLRSARDNWAVRLAALLLFAMICTGVWWLTTLAPTGDSSFM